MNKCIVCGKSDFETIHHGTRDREEIDVWKCRNCGMVRLSDFSQIDSHYYQDSKMRSNQQITAMSYDEHMKNSLRRSSMFAKDYVGKSLLDFGCGRGGFLRLAKGFASEVAGVELEKATRENMISEGFDIRESIDDFGEKKFDFISLFHVIEHLVNPYLYLEKIREHLQNGGGVHC